MNFRIPPEQRLPEYRDRPVLDFIIHCIWYPASPLIFLILLMFVTSVPKQPHLIEPDLSPDIFFGVIKFFFFAWFVFALVRCLATHRSDFFYRLMRLLRTLVTPLGSLFSGEDPLQDIRLGFGSDGAPVTLTPRAAHQHTLIIGSTQTGKSTLAGIWAVQRNDTSLMVIDPHASLVEHLLANGVLNNFPHRAVFPLIPGMDFVPGLNVLQPLPGEAAVDCARRLVDVSSDIFFRGDITAASRFRDVLFHTAWALSATGWTLAEVNTFLQSAAFRAHITRRVTHLPTLHRWLTDAAEMTPTRWRERTESTTNRFRVFETGEPALIFGQRKSTLDLHAFLQAPRALWLAPLTVDALGQDGAYLVAGLLLSTVDALLARRHKGGADNPNFLLLADEFQRYPTVALERLLAERRGYGAAVMLISQGIGQLPPWLRGVIMNNVYNIAAFRLSPEGADLLAPRLFRISPLMVRRRRYDHSVELYNYADALPQYREKLQELGNRVFFLRHGLAPARLVHAPEIYLPDAFPAQISEKILKRRGRPRALVAAELQQRHRQLLAGNFSPTETGDDWH